MRTLADRQFQQILKGHPRPVAELAKSLRQVILAAAPSLREDMKPAHVRYWHKNRTVCAITLHADHVNLQFYYRTNLSDPAHARVGTGKRLRHMTLCQPADIRPTHVKRLLRESISDSD